MKNENIAQETEAAGASCPLPVPSLPRSKQSSKRETAAAREASLQQKEGGWSFWCSQECAQQCDVNAWTYTGPFNQPPLVTNRHARSAWGRVRNALVTSRRGCV